MDKNLIFFFISCCTVSFSIIAIYLDSFISNILNTNLKNKQCQLFRNFDETNYYDEKSVSNKEMKTKIKTYLNKGKKLCTSNKMLNKFKYVSFYTNIFFGILCAILSLLHHYNIGRRFERYTGLLGIISGIVGIILTSVFFVYNGLFNNEDFGKDLIYNTINTIATPDENKKKDVVSYKNNKNEWNNSEKKHYNFYYGENNEELTYQKYKELCQEYMINKKVVPIDDDKDINEKRLFKLDYFLRDNYEKYN